MTRAANLAFHAMHLTLLRGASLMVPVSQRADWYREWTSELWHVRRSAMPIGAFSWEAERELSAFCFGSLQDAACLRRQELDAAVAPVSVHGSARQCLLLLGAVVALCALIAYFLPGVRSETDAALGPFRQGTTLIEPGSYGDNGRPSVPYALYHDWESRRQQFFTNLAFYRIAKERAELDAGRRATWVVAHASENFFGVLGLDVGMDSADVSVPQAVLSQSLWRRAFHSDAAAVGALIRVGHRTVRVAGVAPARMGRLPGGADLWIMETGPMLGQASGSARGYVVALLSPLGQAEMPGDSGSIFTLDAEGNEVDFHGVSLAPQTGGPLADYVFALILAILALPAITTVFKSDSSFASHQPSRKSRAKRGGFLAAKIALIIGLGYYGALDLAYWNVGDYSSLAEFLQFASSFCICLFGLRWALFDQSRRCPVCLRRVTHPAQVGIASCNFLSWNGTEMICMGGHALLHVPSLPTSWFDRQRWMYLDTSWDFLFADTLH